MFGPCYAVLSFLSSFSIISISKTEDWLLYFNCLPVIVLLLLFCVSSLPCGKLGWSAVCGCGISCLYSFSAWSVLYTAKVHVGKSHQSMDLF